VIADLRNADIHPETTHSNRLTSVWNMIRPRQPIAAITGTFFNPRSQRPVADVVVDGKLVARGNRGSAIGVDWYGRVHIIDTKFKKDMDWMAYRYLLRGTVRIVSQGRVTCDPKGQRFKDSRIWGKAARTAVGKTSDGRLVLIATNSAVTLSQLGHAMVSAGVRDAVSLDGGGSTCLYYKGSLVISPKRKLSNLFLVCEGGDDSVRAKMP
jgi:exopolysaccharide biosynthesis protein